MLKDSHELPQETIYSSKIRIIFGVRSHAAALSCDSFLVSSARSSIAPDIKPEAMAMWSEDSNPMFGALIPQCLMGICMLAVPWMLPLGWTWRGVFQSRFHWNFCCKKYSTNGDLSKPRIPKPVILNRRNQAVFGGVVPGC